MPIYTAKIVTSLSQEEAANSLNKLMGLHSWHSKIAQLSPYRGTMEDHAFNSISRVEPGVIIDGTLKQQDDGVVIDIKEE